MLINHCLHIVIMSAAVTSACCNWALHERRDEEVVWKCQEHHWVLFVPWREGARTQQRAAARCYLKLLVLRPGWNVGWPRIPRFHTRSSYLDCFSASWNCANLVLIVPCGIVEENFPVLHGDKSTFSLEETLISSSVIVIKIEVNQNLQSYRRRLVGNSDCSLQLG